MRLTPYIMFNGNCEKTLNFSADTFNGEITELKRFEGSPVESMSADTEKIMHARLKFGESLFMASDGQSTGNVNADSISLSVEFDDVNRMNDIFKKLSEGGMVTMELQDAFWGARFGMLKDQFGINWMLNCKLKK